MHGRARPLPGKQWRVTQETIAVSAVRKFDFKQSSSLLLKFPTGIMKIMMLPSSAGSFKGAAQNLFLKKSCYPFNKYLPQQSTCWKFPRTKWIFSVSFLTFFLKNIFFCYPFLSPFPTSLSVPPFSAPALTHPCRCIGLLLQAAHHVDRLTFCIHVRGHVTAREIQWLQTIVYVTLISLCKYYLVRSKAFHNVLTEIRSQFRGRKSSRSANSCWALGEYKA